MLAFMFGCAGSWLPCKSCLQLWQVEAIPCCSAQASHWGGFCCWWAKTSVVVATRLSSCGAGLSCSAACGMFSDQGLTSVPCIGRWIFLHCNTSEVLVLYFHLSFLLWIKTLHSAYCTLLLILTSRNWDRRGKEGKRIKPHFCCAGSLPHPLSPPNNSFSQSNPTPKGCPGMMGAGTGEQEREPGIYTGGVKSIHEHTAWVSFPNTEMKLTVILRVDQGTDQKSSYSVINSVSKFNFPSNILESQ